MAAIEPGEHELSDEGSYASSAEIDDEISLITFFFGHGGGHGDGGAPSGL